MILSRRPPKTVGKLYSFRPRHPENNFILLILQALIIVACILLLCVRKASIERCQATGPGIKPQLHFTYGGNKNEA